MTKKKKSGKKEEAVDLLLEQPEQPEQPTCQRRAPAEGRCAAHPFSAKGGGPASPEEARTKILGGSTGVPAAAISFAMETADIQAAMADIDRQLAELSNARVRKKAQAAGRSDAAPLPVKARSEDAPLSLSELAEMDLGVEKESKALPGRTEQGPASAVGSGASVADRSPVVAGRSVSPRGEHGTHSRPTTASRSAQRAKHLPASPGRTVHTGSYEVVPGLMGWMSAELRLPAAATATLARHPSVADVDTVYKAVRDISAVAGVSTSAMTRYLTSMEYEPNVPAAGNFCRLLQALHLLTVKMYLDCLPEPLVRPTAAASTNRRGADASTAVGDVTLANVFQDISRGMQYENRRPEPLDASTASGCRSFSPGPSGRHYLHGSVSTGIVRGQIYHQVLLERYPALRRIRPAGEPTGSPGTKRPSSRVQHAGALQAMATSAAAASPLKESSRSVSQLQASKTRASASSASKVATTSMELRTPWVSSIVEKLKVLRELRILDS